jgi:hypothetical protein
VHASAAQEVDPTIRGPLQRLFTPYSAISDAAALRRTATKGKCRALDCGLLKVNSNPQGIKKQEKKKEVPMRSAAGLLLPATSVALLTERGPRKRCVILFCVLIAYI